MVSKKGDIVRRELALVQDAPEVNINELHFNVNGVKRVIFRIHSVRGGISDCHFTAALKVSCGAQACLQDIVKLKSYSHILKHI